MDLNVIVSDCVDWTLQAQEKDHRQGLVNPNIFNKTSSMKQTSCLIQLQ
jgi:hypothetical protein